MGHECAYLWAMYAHIYGPCMRISMGAAMAMNAHIYGPCMRISMGAAMAMNAHIYRAMYTRISIVVVMAM